MADYTPKGDLDYRRNGDTLDDLGDLYDREIPWIFEILNALRANKESTTSRTVEPVACQLKIEDGHIYIRNANNSAWVYIGDVAYALGLIQEGSSLITDADKADPAAANPENNAGKLAVLNEDGMLPYSTNRIAGKRVDMANMADGLVLVYREATNTFTFEAKGGLGAAAALTIMDGDRVVGMYDGSAAVTIDLPFHTLARSTAYAVGDIAYTSALPSNMRLECITAGTTGAELPDELAGSEET